MDERTVPQGGLELQFEKVFVLPGMPSTWTARRDKTSDGVLFSLNTPSNDSGIFVHLIERTGSLRPDEAQDTLNAFVAGAIGFTGSPVVRVIPDGRRQQRAVARFVVPATADRAEQEWLTFIIVWRKHLLICTYNGNAGSPTIDICERLFASLAPLRDA
ncbi:hypothetical protein ABIB25_005835 [Nakamurella sp. UYEF19]|uniref:hypothetical protein n=1 Tax=Nakamurella sp. UYEF19 TaxID=1756392 RepID=UPI00339B906E